jgi:hypothetical protein
VSVSGCEEPRRGVQALPEGALGACALSEGRGGGIELAHARDAVLSRIATEFDVATVVSAANTRDFAEGLQIYRSLLDRTMIPEGLEAAVLGAFKRLCDAAQTNENLAALAAAVFNLSLPPGEALQAISRLMVAVNRVDLLVFPSS